MLNFVLVLRRSQLDALMLTRNDRLSENTGSIAGLVVGHGTLDPGDVVRGKLGIRASEERHGGGPSLVG